MYGLVYANMADYVRKEGFAGGSSAGGEMIVALLVVVLLVVVQLFVVQWLWNTVLVRVLSIARPIPSLWYALGLLVLVAMVHPGTVVTASA
jgi:hypothetical protein